MSNEDKPTCTICDSTFCPETEGGDIGFIGILPVAFCPTCRAGIFDYAEQMSYGWEDEDADEESEAAHGDPKNGCAVHSLSAPREDETAVDPAHRVGDDP